MTCFSCGDVAQPDCGEAFSGEQQMMAIARTLDGQSGGCVAGRAEARGFGGADHRCSGSANFAASAARRTVLLAEQNSIFAGTCQSSEVIDKGQIV